ncbi:MAG: tetratricopeptide repeat protein [Phycisphaeraceae bacterium]|nr:tetratricopeptide repeat protein [Phycisphaeraceae bacterium]
MASRVNTRFVTILVVCLIIAAAVVGAALFLQKGAADQIAKAQVLLEQGDTKNALDQYDSALRKEPNNYEWIMAYVAAMESLRTTDAYDARTTIGRMSGWLNQAMNVRPQETEPFRKLAELRLQLAKDFRSIDDWNGLYQLADQRLQKNLDVDLARRYRGIAQSARIQAIDLPQQERQQAIDDLLATLEKDPGDVETAMRLAQVHLFQARQLERSGGRAEEIKEQRDQAKVVTAALIKIRSDDPQTLVNHARVLIQVRENQEALAMLNEAQTLLQSDMRSPELVLSVAELLPMVDSEIVEVVVEGETLRLARGYQTATALLQKANAQWPDNLSVQMAIGRLLQVQGKLVEAADAYLKVRESNAPAAPLPALWAEQVKATASIQYANMMLTRAGISQEAQIQQELLAKAEPVVKELTERSADNASIKVLRGKIAFIKGQLTEALRLLDEASTQMGDTDPEVLMFAASIAEKLNQVGDAARRVAKVVELNPTLVTQRRYLANLYLRAGENDLCQQQVSILLQQDPGDAEVLRLQAALFARKKQFDKAIRIFQAMDPENNPRAKLAIANLHEQAGQTDQARQLALEAFDKDPKNFTALQMLRRLIDDPDTIRQLIAKAQEAGMPADMAKLMTAQVGGPEEMAKAIDELMAAGKEENPFEWHWTRFRLFQQQGKEDQARVELAAAAKLKPDNGQIIYEQFQFALQDKDFVAAQKLADSAAALNLDAAQGQFFLGQLYLMQENVPGAIEVLRKALAVRKVYSDGWQLLGRAYQTEGNLDAAIDAYQQALAQRPNNVAALRGLASVFASKGQKDESLRTLRKAAEYSPDDLDLRSLAISYEERYGSPQRAFDERKALAAEEPQYYENRRALALLMARMSQIQPALETIDAVIAEEGPTRQNVSAAAVTRAMVGQVIAGRDLLVKYVQGLGDKASPLDWVVLARYLLQMNDLEQALAAYQKALTLEDPQTRPVSRELASQLFTRQRYREASQLYEKLYTQNPEDRQIGLQYIEAQIRSGMLDQAQALLDKFTGKFGHDVKTLMLQGAIAQTQSNEALLRGDLQGSVAKKNEALTAFNRAVEMAPRTASAYYRRAALLYTDPDKDAQVIADLNQAMSLDPDLTAARELVANIYIARNEMSDAQRELNNLIDRQPDNVNARDALAKVYLAQRRFTELGEIIKDSANRFPTDPRWPQWQAEMARAQGQTDLALQSLRVAFELAPSPPTLAALLEALVIEQRYQPALNIMDQQRQLVDTQPVLLALRGRALAGLKHEAQADEIFKRAVDISTQFAQLEIVAEQLNAAFGPQKSAEKLGTLATGDRALVMELLVARYETSAGNTESAINRLEKIKKSLAADSPLAVVSERYLGMALLLAKRSDAAVESFRRLVEVDANNVEALNNLAFVLANDLGKPQEALPYAERAFSLAPRNADILDTLGWIQFKVGQSTDSLATMQKANRMRPSAYSAYHLGKIYQSLGQQASAQEQFQAAAKMAKDTGNQDLLTQIQKELPTTDSN